MSQLFALLRVYVTVAMLLATVMASPVESSPPSSDDATPPSSDDATPPSSDDASAGRIQADSSTTKADIEDYPWQGYLLTKHLRGEMGACGAVLLSAEWALTTAHCMHGVRSATVLSGSNSWVAMILGREGNQLPVTSVFVHPSYWPWVDPLMNNLALLQLHGRTNTSESITPIRLPFPSQLHIKLEGKKVKVSGWGASSGDSEGLSATLQSAELSVMSALDCATAYGYSVIRPAIMCGQDDKGGAAGICKGDSGVAVSYRKGRDNFLVGIAQFRDNSCAAGAPTGFVRVDAYLPWITEVTGITE